MKKNSKKLTLKKETICDLNATEMNSLRGKDLMTTGKNTCWCNLPTPAPTPTPAAPGGTPTPPIGQSDGCYSATGSDVLCCA